MDTLKALADSAAVVRTSSRRSSGTTASDRAVASFLTVLPIGNISTTFAASMIL